MKKVLYFGVMALLFTSTGCVATQGYVQEQNDILNGKINDLQMRMTALENAVNRIPATLPLSSADREMLQKADGAAQRADSSARKAEEMAQKAAASADSAADSAKKADAAASSAQEAAKKGEKILNLGQKK